MAWENVISYELFVGFSHLEVILSKDGDSSRNITYEWFPLLQAETSTYEKYVGVFKDLTEKLGSSLLH